MRIDAYLFAVPLLPSSATFIGRCLHALRSIECLTLWSATGVIVAASAGGVISVINAFNSTISGYIEKPCESTPTCLTFCPKGKKLFVACEDGCDKLFFFFK